MKFNFNINAAASKCKTVPLLQRRRTLDDALAEARKPLTVQQQRVKERVEAAGNVYAVNGSGMGCVFDK